MIYTSYFQKVKMLAGKNTNLVFVSIAGYMPDWCKQSIIPIYEFKKLAPKYSWWKIWKQKFSNCLNSQESINWYKNEYYTTILDNLDANEIRQELMDLSNNMNVVLLCYEKPNNFCHRFIVSEWLNENNISCIEID